MKEELKEFLANHSACDRENIYISIMKAIDEFFDQYQPERSKREDLERSFPDGKCPFCKKGIWESLHQGCGALNTMET